MVPMVSTADDVSVGRLVRAAVVIGGIVKMLIMGG